MKRSSPLEPGILRTFRIFIGIRLALVINSLFYLGFFTDWDFSPKYILIISLVIFDAGMLFAYLSWSRLLTVLKNYYLPIAIFWATLGPMIQTYGGFLLLGNESTGFFTYFMTPLPFLVLFIPLVIVAWQYTHRYVFYFCTTTFLIDGIFALQLYQTSVLAFITLFGMSVIRTLLFLLVGNMIANLMKVQREQRMRITETYNRLANYSLTMEQLAISRERNRVARELHDILAHTISGVAIEMEGIKANIKTNPDKASELLDHYLTAMRQGLNETRQTLQNLRSSPIEELGLVNSIHHLIESLPINDGCHFNLQIDEEIVNLSSDVEHCFYRVAQEAINNILLHAQASEVCIQLHQHGETTKMSIQDNGTGFDPLKVDQVSSYGLLGMKERAELIRAGFSVDSKPGMGTKIELIYGAD